jgi:hypothetical protein
MKIQNDTIKYMQKKKKKRRRRMRRRRKKRNNKFNESVHRRLTFLQLCIECGPCRLSNRRGECFGFFANQIGLDLGGHGGRELGDFRA